LPGDLHMPKLYLVRHAEPELTGVLLGSSDPPLSKEGKRQAAAILLPGAAVIYTSGLRRARETAELIGGAPIIVDPDLNEISYGKWDGLSWAQISEKYPHQARSKLADWKTVTPPDGEDWTSFEERIARALDRIRNGSFPAAVVAHVTVNAQIIHSIAGIEPSQFTQPYCEVLIYDL
jgi:broad specificity phosphatase PhoE